MIQQLTGVELHGLLRSTGEHALLDVREQGVFGREHILQANCIPLSHVELLIDSLVPRRDTRIVLCDAGPAGAERLARRAAARLAALGYSNVAILEGGIDAWRSQRRPLYSGINVPSKAFGEFVEHQYHTPRITAQELFRRMNRGDSLLILDSRPFSEYHRMSIPSGIDVPGAELVHRVHDLKIDASTDIVVNCAGRTRSIIGAQSLINAGVPNRVMALKDGTMGWRLAGLELEFGQTRRAPKPTVQGREASLHAAARVAERFGVHNVDLDTLYRWRGDPTRTLYLLDVRSPEEYVAGHLKGSRPAPGGQLVQATDEYIATRNGRVILADDDGVRATMTASWLIQMGWNDVYVLRDALEGEIEKGEFTPTVLGYRHAATVDPLELKAALDSGESVQVIDLASSLEYQARHLPGAWWSPRSRLNTTLTMQPPIGLLVLTSQDARLAHLAAQDLARVRPQQLVRVLDGGTDAWVAHGLPVTDGIEHATSDTNDVWYKPYEHQDAVSERMQKYLDWEVALVEQTKNDDTVNFRYFD